MTCACGSDVWFCTWLFEVEWVGGSDWCTGSSGWEDPEGERSEEVPGVHIICTNWPCTFACQTYEFVLAASIQKAYQLSDTAFTDPHLCSPARSIMTHSIFSLEPRVPTSAPLMSHVHNCRVVTEAARPTNFLLIRNDAPRVSPTSESADALAEGHNLEWETYSYRNSLHSR